MLSTLQTAVISLLDSKIIEAEDYPKVVKIYSGALESVKELKKQVKNTPEIHVGVGNADIESDEVLGRSAHTGDYMISVYGFESNKAGRKANVNAGIELAEWAMDSLKGAVLTINGSQVALSKKMKLTTQEHIDPFVFAIDCEVTVHE